MSRGEKARTTLNSPIGALSNGTCANAVGALLEKKNYFANYWKTIARGRKAGVPLNSSLRVLSNGN